MTSTANKFLNFGGFANFPTTIFDYPNKISLQVSFLFDFLPFSGKWGFRGGRGAREMPVFLREEPSLARFTFSAPFAETENAVRFPIRPLGRDVPGACRDITG